MKYLACALIILCFASHSQGLDLSLLQADRILDQSPQKLDFEDAFMSEFFYDEDTNTFAQRTPYDRETMDLTRFESLDFRDVSDDAFISLTKTKIIKVRDNFDLMSKKQELAEILLTRLSTQTLIKRAQEDKGKVILSNDESMLLPLLCQGYADNFFDIAMNNINFTYLYSFGETEDIISIDFYKEAFAYFATLTHLGKTLAKHLKFLSHGSTELPQNEEDVTGVLVREARECSAKYLLPKTLKEIHRLSTESYTIEGIAKKIYLKRLKEMIIKTNYIFPFAERLK